jgi:isoleucyl-tRNA synthetase
MQRSSLQRLFSGGFFMPFRAIPAAVDLPAVEHSILKFWRENSIFEKTVAAREGAPTWTFYEGPPTAN